MIGAMRSPAQQLVTVFGGSGFLGGIRRQRPGEARLSNPRRDAAAGSRLQASASRGGRADPSGAGEPARCRFGPPRRRQGRPRRQSRRHPEGERPATFAALQAEGPRLIAETAHRDARLVHVSAIGADARSPADYARTKAAGEAGLLAARPDATVFRPSVLFGPNDGFFSRFAALARCCRCIPLAGAETPFQPVYAGDVAEAIARAVDGGVAGGRIYELGGPEVRTLRDFVEYVLRETERRRFVVPLPGVSRGLQGALIGALDA